MVRGELVLRKRICEAQVGRWLLFRSAPTTDRWQTCPMSFKPDFGDTPRQRFARATATTDLGRLFDA
jgi:hypothetical protein